MDFNVANVTRDEDDNPLIARLVDVARENGMNGTDEQLYAFVKMVFTAGEDSFAIDTVAPSYNITHGYLDDYIPGIDDEGILDEDGNFEKFEKYVDEHVDEVRYDGLHIAEAKDFIFDAVVDYGNYRTDEDLLELKIAEELFRNFRKSITK